MREQQKATMYPFLSLSRSYNNEGFGVFVRNSGTGLARIHAVELTNGEQYFNNWVEVVEAYLPDSLQFGYDRIRATTINELIITPNETVRLFEVSWSPETRLLEEVTRGGLDMTICYSSLLGDHWRVVSDGQPEEISEPCERIEERQLY